MVKIVNENGKWYAVDGDKKTELHENKDHYARLPEGNSSNRTWIKWSELPKKEGQELPYHEKAVRVKSEFKGMTWVDFLDEKERATYDKLKAEGEKRFEEAKNRKPTEEEKLLADIARQEKALAKLYEKRDKKASE